MAEGTSDDDRLEPAAIATLQRGSASARVGCASPLESAAELLADFSA